MNRIIKVKNIHTDEVKIYTVVNCGAYFILHGGLIIDPTALTNGLHQGDLILKEERK